MSGYSSTITPKVDLLGDRAKIFNGRSLDNEKDPWFCHVMPEGVKDITKEQALLANRKLRVEQFEKDYNRAFERRFSPGYAPTDFVYMLPEGYLENKIKEQQLNN